MMISKTLSQKKFPIVPRWFIVVFVVIGFIGFLDATYLTAEHYLGFGLNCSIINGCEEVTTSPYSVVMGFPVALYGAMYYLLLFLLGVMYLDSGKDIVLYFAMLFTPLGFFASLWFLYLQVFVIKALCLYCLVSAGTSTTLFALGIYYWHLLAKGIDVSAVKRVDSVSA